MRRVYLPDDIEQTVEEARGATSFEQWVADAIRERAIEQRILYVDAAESYEDIYVAVILSQGGGEGILGWRVRLPEVGDTIYPVIAATEEGMEAWNELIALELNMMDGPPVQWRRWDRIGCGDREWLRQEAPE